MKLAALAVALAGIAAALVAGCRRQQPGAAPPPAQTSVELEGAGRLLEHVGDRVPLVKVDIRGAGGGESRIATGAVVTSEGGILVAAAPLSLAIDEAGQAGDALARSIMASFPGGDAGDTRECTAERINADARLALLTAAPPGLEPLEFGGDLAAGDRVYVLGTAPGLTEVAAYAGKALRYEGSGEARMLLHTAGAETGAAGPVFDRDGRLVALQVASASAEAQRSAIAADAIARWLQSPPEDETAPAEPGVVLPRLLEAAQLDYRASEEGGYALADAGGLDVRVEQRESLVAVTVALGVLEIGHEVEALRFNYMDPLGSLALKASGRAEVLRWTAKIHVDAAKPEYLSYAVRVAGEQARRWQAIRAGIEAEQPYDLYPGGNESELEKRLDELVEASGLAYEETADGYRLRPQANVPVYVKIYRGMGYVHAYSGGMPGTGDVERDEIARALLRRSWEMPLGRLALDRYDDLAWEAQVPMQHLTPGYLQMLVRAGESEVTHLVSTYGDIAFNEPSDE